MLTGKFLLAAALPLLWAGAGAAAPDSHSADSAVIAQADLSSPDGGGSFEAVTPGIERFHNEDLSSPGGDTLGGESLGGGSSEPAGLTPERGSDLAPASPSLRPSSDIPQGGLGAPGSTGTTSSPLR